MSHSGPSAVQIVLSEDERAELVRRAGLPVWGSKTRPLGAGLGFMQPARDLPSSTQPRTRLPGAPGAPRHAPRFAPLPCGLPLSLGTLPVPKTSSAQVGAVVGGSGDVLAGWHQVGFFPEDLPAAA